MQNGFGTSGIYVDAGERNTINIGNTIDITYKDHPEYNAKITPDFIMFNSTGGSNTMMGAGSITVNGEDVLTTGTAQNIIKEATSSFLTKQALIELLYPVGSIYISMNNVNPSVLFGGTWTQILGRFLLCDGSDSKQTGGSPYITENCLPPHTHTFSGKAITGTVNYDPGTSLLSTAAAPTGCFSKDTSNTTSYRMANQKATGYGIAFNATPSGTISSTGYGRAYWPQYMTCYGWYRTA